MMFGARCGRQPCATAPRGREKGCQARPFPLFRLCLRHTSLLSSGFEEARNFVTPCAPGVILHPYTTHSERPTTHRIQDQRIVQSPSRLQRVARMLRTNLAAVARRSLSGDVRKGYTRVLWEAAPLALASRVLGGQAYDRRASGECIFCDTRGCVLTNI